MESIRRFSGKLDINAPSVSLNPQITSNVMRYLELQEQKKKVKSEENRIESELKRLRGCILDVMGKSCNAECTIGDTEYRIEYNPTFKPVIDKDNLFRLKEQFPDVYNKFVTFSESRRFYVKKSHSKAA